MPMHITIAAKQRSALVMTKVRSWILTKQLSSIPSFVDAYSNRGLAKYNLEELQDAYFDFSKALEIGPADADKYFNRGVVKAELGE